MESQQCVKSEVTEGTWFRAPETTATATNKIVNLVQVKQ